MKIVNIIGGLGNQMFQYAFAIVLRQSHPSEKVFIDIQHFHYLFFKRFKTSNLHNGYELSKIFPHLDIPVAGVFQLLQVTSYIPNFFLSRIARKILPKRKTEYVANISESQKFRPELLTLQGNRYFEGYWQAAGYYSSCKSLLCKIFSHPLPNEYNKEMIKSITESASVGIHIRRGEYLLSPRYSGICEIDYYQKAIETITNDTKQHHFFIFSNDMEWCRNNILPLISNHPVTFVTGNKNNDSYWDMFLMAYCHDLIIANSSFSWWGAFLNRNAHRIIAPYPWMNGRNTDDIYDSSWVKINLVQ